MLGAAVFIRGLRESGLRPVARELLSSLASVAPAVLALRSGELAAYQHGINTVAQANPIVTKREDTFAHGQQTAQTDTSTGGFDLAAAQQESASSASPQVAAHQQATTYYSALVQALSAAA